MDKAILHKLKLIVNLPKPKFLNLIGLENQEEILYFNKNQISEKILELLTVFCKENNLHLTEKTDSYLVSTSILN